MGLLVSAERIEFEDIMTFKRRGEVELEQMYANAPKGVTYTIVRPGGLTDGPVVGPKGVAQDNTYRHVPFAGGCPCSSAQHPISEGKTLRVRMTGREQDVVEVDQTRRSPSWHHF